MIGENGLEKKSENKSNWNRPALLIAATTAMVMAMAMGHHGKRYYNYGYGVQSQQNDSPASPGTGIEQVRCFGLATLSRRSHFRSKDLAG